MKAVNGIPILGYGTWPLAGDECYRGVSMALELGIRHIDSAQNYGNEREVGRAIAASQIEEPIMSRQSRVVESRSKKSAGPSSVDRPSLGQVAAGHIVHHEVKEAPKLAGLAEADDVAMAQAAQVIRLAAEALALLRIQGQLRPD